MEGINKIKADLNNILKRKSLILCLIVVLTCSYLYFITHTAIGVDDLTSERYLSGELFAQGRFTGQIIDAVFPFDTIESIYNLLGIGLYGFSTLLFLTIFNSILRLKNSSSYIVFACIFVSYPLVVEIFIYHGLPFAIGGNMLLISIILLIIFYRIKYWTFFSPVLFFFACAWHEGEIPVYICAVFSILFLIKKKNTNVGLRYLFTEGVIYGWPLAIGFAVKIIVAKIILRIMDLQQSTMAGTSINYFRYPLIDCLYNIKESIKIEYLLKAGYSLPIFCLLLSVVILFIITIFYSVKEKTILFFLCYIGMFFSLFSLTILTGNLMPYRVSQVFTYFIAFTCLMILDTIKNKIGLYLAKCALVWLIINQIIQLNFCFELDYIRSQNELSTVRMIGYDLITNYDVSKKPVIFIGNYSDSEYLSKMYISSSSAWAQVLGKINLIDLPENEVENWIKIPQVYGNSVISWGISAFDEVNTELLRVFKFCGYDLKQGNEGLLEEAQSQGYSDKKIEIKENDNCIIVHFN